MDVVEILRSASFYCGTEREFADLFEYARHNIQRYDPSTGMVFGSSSQLLGTVSTLTLNSWDKMIEAFNITLRSICTDRIVVKKEMELEFVTNKIALYNIHNVNRVYYVMRNGKKIPFSVSDDGLLVIDKPGKVVMGYSYIPPSYGASDSVDFLFGKINETVLALGTASEYLYMVGQYDDAEMIRKRYIEEADKIDNRRKIMPAKRWLK